MRPGFSPQACEALLLASLPRTALAGPITAAAAAAPAESGTGAVALLQAWGTLRKVGIAARQSPCCCRGGSVHSGRDWCSDRCARERVQLCVATQQDKLSSPNFLEIAPIFCLWVPGPVGARARSRRGPANGVQPTTRSKALLAAAIARTLESSPCFRLLLLPHAMPLPCALACARHFDLHSSRLTGAEEGHTKRRGGQHRSLQQCKSSSSATAARRTLSGRGAGRGARRGEEVRGVGHLKAVPPVPLAQLARLRAPVPGPPQARWRHHRRVPHLNGPSCPPLSSP